MDGGRSGTPDDSFHDGIETDGGCGQSGQQRIVAVGDAEATIAFDGISGALVLRERGDADALFARGVETLDETSGGHALRGIVVAALDELGEGAVALFGGGALDVFENAIAALGAGIAGNVDHAAGEFEQFQTGGARDIQNLGRAAMDEFRAEFDGDGSARVVDSMDAAADPVARFQTDDAQAGAVQIAERSESRSA